MTLDFPAHRVDPDVETILDRIQGNDAYSDDRYEVVRAILKTADENEGVVDPNNVRGELEDVAARYVIGATYHALTKVGVLKVIGWTINGDRDGHNGGKPIRLYEIVYGEDAE